MRHATAWVDAAPSWRACPHSLPFVGNHVHSTRPCASPVQDAEAPSDDVRRGSLRGADGHPLVVIDKLNQPTPVTARLEGTQHTPLAAHFTRGRLNNPLHVRVMLPNGEDKEALLSSEVILTAFLQPGSFTGLADYIHSGFTEMDLQDCWSDPTLHITVSAVQS
jgi:hypothetical protein